VDYQKFINQLPNLYENWGQESVRPKSSKFQKIREHIAGFTTENILQLLNFAIACLKTDEIYCEIGCGEGATLIGALLNHSDKEAFAIDKFYQFDDSEVKLKKLIDNLSTFNLEDQVLFCDQDFLEFFTELQEVYPTNKIGVIFYNAYQDYRTQLLELLLAKPFLAEQALIITHSSNWSPVQQANWDFMSVYPQSQLLLNLSTPIDFHPTFGNGIEVLIWDSKKKFNDSWSKSNEIAKELIINSSPFLIEFQQPKPIFIPAVYLKFDDFLTLEENKQFLDIALQRKADFARAEVGDEIQNIDVRQSFFMTSESFPKGAELIVSKILKVVPEVIKFLNKPQFRVSKIEVQLTIHKDCCFYKLHTDNDPPGIGDCTREITYVYYLYREPKSFYGGELRIYDTQIANHSFRINGNFKEIQPQNNSIVFFDSRCLHEVMPVSCSSKSFEDSRFTINGWIHI